MVQIDFEDRTAIVTGGSSGIGRAISLKLSEEGASVVVADIQPEPSIDEEPTHEKIESRGGESLFVQTDVSNEEDVREMLEAAEESYGEMDILVNDAGVYHPASVTDETVEGFHEIIDVNLRGVFFCSKYVIGHMVENGIEGDIVNISSIAGLVGYGESAAYCASKGGIIELTREMALDYGAEGINVNSVAPGVIKTAMTKDMLEDDETRQFIESSTIAPRIGKPEDIANAVAFLASGDSDFILGETLVVDGGWVAH